ncbi:MAG: phosphoglycerate dehydrogenase [Spirochaetales bacterium]|nr:phosphoglycerate dehydrogenase [Spirochaetales bacterium]
MSKGKILVTPRSMSKNGHPFLKNLEEAGYEVLTPFPGKQPSKEELLSVLPECTGYLAGVEKVDADVINACDKLKVISRNGVGIDNVDRAVAEAKDITLCITPGANSRGVAELAITLMLSALRSIPQTSDSVKNGGWARTKGQEVYGRTLGVIGTGQIGRHVAKMAAGLDMKVLGYDLYPNTEFEQQMHDFSYASVEDVLKNSDVVTLHCPAGEKPLIDGDALKSMKKGVTLINTARAALVDQDALLEALESGQVSSYAVDAFESEPPELTPLLLHPRVILSSHIGGFTEESVDRATAAAIQNIIDELK